MSVKNLQDGNVGNEGDILKHAALVQLAKLFAGTIPENRFYLESHCYLYQSAIAEPNWRNITGAYHKHFPPYQEYIDFEQAYVDSGNYLCSSGLVSTIIADARLMLCEADDDTRERLLSQLGHAGVKDFQVRTELADWTNDSAIGKLPNLLALIDPFSMDEKLWQSMENILYKILAHDAKVILLLFDYENSATKHWPGFTKIPLSLVAKIDRQPFHLAVYSSDDFTGACQHLLSEMGWNISDK